MAVELEKQLGDGGFADVWKGKDDLDRPVAVKIIREANVMMSDALAHAKALARTNHPNVVTVYRIDKVIDPTTNIECDCVVMELINGITLASFLRDTTLLTKTDAQRLVIGIIDGISHIHSQGIVHGDLHEENVMVVKDDVKIIDILYRDTLALLSSASKDFRIRRDISSLNLLIEQILEHSEYGLELLVSFRSKLPPQFTLSDLREAAIQVLGDSSSRVLPEISIPEIKSPFVDPAVFFFDRFTAAFPGVRDIAKFDDPQIAIQRLEILLKHPLGFRMSADSPDRDGLQRPIWWWRGLWNCEINSFCTISPTEILLYGLRDLMLPATPAYLRPGPAERSNRESNNSRISAG